MTGCYQWNLEQLSLPCRHIAWLPLPKIRWKLHPIHAPRLQLHDLDVINAKIKRKKMFLTTALRANASPLDYTGDFPCLAISDSHTGPTARSVGSIGTFRTKRFKIKTMWPTVLPYIPFPFSALIRALEEFKTTLLRGRGLELGTLISMKASQQLLTKIVVGMRLWAKLKSINRTLSFKLVEPIRRSESPSHTSMCNDWLNR